MNNTTEATPLPDGYTAYGTLTFCSNVLIGGGVPIKAKGHFPVLVGKGPQAPVIWLAATRQGQDWQPVVERNEPKNPNFVVNLLGDGQSVQVVLGNFVIVQARQISEDEAEVTILDLRPLGINIQGSRNGMQVGTNGFSHNTFKGGGGMIDLG